MRRTDAEVLGTVLRPLEGYRQNVLELSYFLEFLNVITENVNSYKDRYIGNNRGYIVKIFRKMRKTKVDTFITDYC